MLKMENITPMIKSDIEIRVTEMTVTEEFLMIFFVPSLMKYARFLITAEYLAIFQKETSVIGDQLGQPLIMCRDDHGHPQ